MKEPILRQFLRWHLIKDELPKNGGAYLVSLKSIWSDDKTTDTMWFNLSSNRFIGSFKDLVGYKIEAWAEMPKPMVYMVADYD